MKRSTKFQSFYAEPSGGEAERCLYPVRLDTYGCGCAHDCAYCYARSLLDFRGLWRPDNPSVASADYISKKLSKVKAGTILRLGGMTDCFQPCERDYRATYQTIKMLNARRIGYLIVTKSDLVVDPLYMNIYDPELAHFQITVTSTSDKPNVLKENATPPSMRIRAAETLSKAGYDVALRISPYIPKLVDTERINATGIKTLVEFLRVNHWIEKWLGGGLEEYALNSGGYRHLPLEVKLGLLEAFTTELSVCEDVPEHYDYFRQRINANKDDCCNLRS